MDGVRVGLLAIAGLAGAAGSAAALTRSLFLLHAAVGSNRVTCDRHWAPHMQCGQVLT
jgi:hypothetical protein